MPESLLQKIPGIVYADIQKLGLEIEKWFQDHFGSLDGQVKSNLETAKNDLHTRLGTAVVLPAPANPEPQPAPLADAPVTDPVEAPAETPAPAPETPADDADKAPAADPAA